MADEVKTNQEAGDVSTEEKKVTNPIEGGVTEKADDVQKMIQSAVDKSISKVKKEYESKLSEMERQLAEERKSKMSEEEKAEARAKEIEERDKLIAERERRLTIIEALTDAGLPKDFANRISGDTEDEIKDDVQALKKFLESKAHELSESEIARRLKGDPPKGGDTKKKLTYEEITQIPDRKERIKAYKEHGYA
jgi:hypothetical protein